MGVRVLVLLGAMIAADIVGLLEELLGFCSGLRSYNVWVAFRISY